MKMRPLETAPKDGTYILLFGSSGYTTTPFRCEVCRYDADYHPKQPWVNHANNSFLDSGDSPIGWLPLPKDTPTAEEVKAQFEGSRNQTIRNYLLELCGIIRTSRERISPYPLNEDIKYLLELPFTEREMNAFNYVLEWTNAVYQNKNKK